MTALRIIGIDPGSRFTGFGIVDCTSQRMQHVKSGCISVRDLSIPQRLLQIYEQLKHMISIYRPQQMAIETVFVKVNSGTALKLGQARGVAILAGMTRELKLHEYAPTAVKLAIVGRGHADKAQVNHMVRSILCLSQTLQEDEADALAVAICDGHTTLSGYHQQVLNKA